VSASCISPTVITTDRGSPAQPIHSNRSDRRGAPSHCRPLIPGALPTHGHLAGIRWVKRTRESAVKTQRRGNSDRGWQMSRRRSRVSRSSTRGSRIEDNKGYLSVAQKQVSWPARDLTLGLTGRPVPQGHQISAQCSRASQLPAACVDLESSKVTCLTCRCASYVLSECGCAIMCWVSNPLCELCVDNVLSE